jgi:hypothetical protein
VQPSLPNPSISPTPIPPIHPVQPGPPIQPLVPAPPTRPPTPILRNDHTGQPMLSAEDVAALEALIIRGKLDAGA